MIMMKITKFESRNEENRKETDNIFIQIKI